MGWNDSRFVDALSHFKLIALLFLLSVTFFSTQDIIAQPAKGEEGKKVITYKIDCFFPVTIRNHYSYSEKTEVTRIYSDDSEIKFSRELTFFFDVKAPGQSRDGFTILDISIDSMHYKYIKDNLTYEYNSQNSIPGNFKIMDFLATIVPLGKFFFLTYSPYGNVSKIEGEELLYFINSLKKKEKSMDPINKYIWMEGVSTNRLKHITDMKKINYPSYAIAEDSTFITPLTFQLNHINIQDTVEMKFESVSNGYMKFIGKIGDVETTTKQARFEDIDDNFVEIIDLKANGIITTELAPRGTPEETIIDLNIQVKGKIKKEIFIEKVKTKMKWQLLGQWQY